MKGKEQSILESRVIRSHPGLALIPRNSGKENKQVLSRLETLRRELVQCLNERKGVCARAVRKSGRGW